jgi:ribose/xylose/arabinose/galactoside ABC-type transport system permease subunit
LLSLKDLSKNAQDVLKRIIVSEYFILVLSVVYFLIIAAIVPTMFTLHNVSNILSNIWPLLAIAIGQTFVLLLGGIDLSQTSVISLTSVMGSMLISRSFNPSKFGKSPLWGWFIKETGGLFADMPEVVAVLLCILVMLAIGYFIGALNGLMIARTRIPAFMVTLITQMFFAAVALYITQSQNITGIPSGFSAIGSKGIGVIPYSLLVTATLLILAQILLSKTVRGRFIYSTGANIRTARVSGVPTVKTTVFVYGISGLCAAIGSVLYTGRLMMGRPTLGETMLMDVIGATVIGGTSMFGGKGKVVWTLYGVIFYCILSTSLTHLKLDSFTVNVVKGVVIILAASLDVIRSRIQQQGTAIKSKKKGANENADSE